MENIFLCQSFVNYVSQPLGAGFRCKGQAALFNILYLAHYIQREGVNTQGRQGDVYTLAVKLVNQEIDKSFQLCVITGA